MSIRQYAGGLGVIILLIGVSGLLLGNRQLFGVLNIDLAEDILHILLGGVLAWVGFGQRDSSLARAVVTAGGAGLVVLGVLGFFRSDLFGLLPSHYSNLDNVTHIILGALSIAAARVLGRDAGEAPGRHAEGRAVRPGA